MRPAGGALAQARRDAYDRVDALRGIEKVLEYRNVLSNMTTLSLAVDVEDPAAAVDGHEEVRKHDRDDGHELHDDVERGARRVLEGVADGVADDGRGVRLADFFPA